MTASLPADAFVPRDLADGNERHAFAGQRDRLFAHCTGAEQRCLLALADWYGRHWHRLIGRPNVFDTCVAASFELRYTWLPGPKPHPVLVAWIRSMALVGRAIAGVEGRIGAWSQWRCLALLRSCVAPGDEDVLLGVVDFLRALPLQVGALWEQAPLQDRLAALTRDCMASRHVSARRRMDAALRCIDRNHDPVRHALPDGTNDLRRQCWPLLLELAREDLPAALHVVDAQAARQGQATALSTLDLHEAPELAYQLAMALHGHRPAIAAGLLRESVQYASFQRSRLTGEPAAGLERVMDASCRLLADWIAPAAELPDDDVLQSIHQLFCYGNPADPYWAALPPRALALVRLHPGLALERRLRLLAQVAFYGAGCAPRAAEEALALFDGCVAATFASLQLTDADRQADRVDLWSTVGMAVSDMSRPLQLVEDKQLSMRNCRIAASPRHPLVDAFAARMDQFDARLLAQEPAHALHQLALAAVNTHHEGLFRRQHGRLRDRIQERAPRFPDDAGHALKTVIQSCGGSQAGDQAYRQTVSQETFEALLPLLESISPEAAAHARTGVRWNPRGDL